MHFALGASLISLEVVLNKMQRGVKMKTCFGIHQPGAYHALLSCMQRLLDDS